jgi:hypothetical protein
LHTCSLLWDSLMQPCFPQLYCRSRRHTTSAKVVWQAGGIPGFHFRPGKRLGLGSGLLKCGVFSSGRSPIVASGSIQWEQVMISGVQPTAIMV